MSWLQIKKVTFFVAVFFSHSIVASEYTFTKSIGLKGLFNDNASLLPNTKNNRYGGTGVAKFNLSKRTDNSQLIGDINLSANNYNLESYNTFDQVMSVSYTRIGEKGSWGLSGNYNRDSTRSLDPEDQGLDFSGLIDTRIFSKRISANWNRRINEKNTVAWNAVVSDVEYESDFRNGYVYGQTSLLWQYYVSERLRLQANMAYSVLDTDQTSNLVSSPLFLDALAGGIFTVDQTIVLIDGCRVGSNQIALFSEILYGPDNGIDPWPCFEERFSDNTQSTKQLQLGIYYMLTENLVLDLLAGRSIVDTESELSFLNVPPLGDLTGQRIERTENDDKGSVFKGSLEYIGSSWRSALRVSRDTTVNSNSALSLVTKVSWDMRWRLNQYHSIGGTLSWTQQEASSKSGNVFFDRDLAVAMLRHDYDFAEDWKLTTLYRLNDQVRLGQDDHGRSNQLAVIVTWKPTVNMWSR